MTICCDVLWKFISKELNNLSVNNLKFIKQNYLLKSMKNRTCFTTLYTSTYILYKQKTLALPKKIKFKIQQLSYST